MRLKQGYTRYVILHGDVAIKITKIRWWRIITRPFLAWRQGRARQVVSKHKTAPVNWFVRAAFTGMLANRFEYQCGQHEELADIVAKTSRLYLRGLISIQERGTPVSLDEARQHPFWNAMMAETAGNERNAASQFARFSDGLIRVVDLGEPERLCPVLRLWK